MNWTRLRLPLTIFVLGQVERNRFAWSRTFVSPENTAGFRLGEETAILCTHPHRTLDTTLLGTQQHQLGLYVLFPQGYCGTSNPVTRIHPPWGFQIRPPMSSIPSQLEIQLTRSIYCGQSTMQRQILVSTPDRCSPLRSRTVKGSHVRYKDHARHTKAHSAELPVT